MKRIMLAALAFSAALAGCATVDVTKTAKGFYEPTDPNNVEILRTVPTRPFAELGTVTAYDFAPGDTAVLHNEIRNKVAPLGADAAIINSEGIGPGRSGGMRLWATGTAIKFKNRSGKSNE